ncbi:Uncharacterised protein [Streptococcus pneumoniae]|nr:Uncharacterised protein [Streptococcus pneumoniae]
MSKVDQLIRSINVFVQKVESDEVEELEAAVADFPELTDIPSLVEEYEKTTAKLLRLQRRTFLNELNGFYIQGRFGDVRINSSILSK